LAPQRIIKYVVVTIAALTMIGWMLAGWKANIQFWSAAGALFIFEGAAAGILGAMLGLLVVKLLRMSYSGSTPARAHSVKIDANIGTETTTVYELGVDDMISFALYDYSRSPQYGTVRRRMRIILLSAALFWLAFGTVAALLFGNDQLLLVVASSMILFGSATLLWYLFSPFLYRFLLRRHISRTYREGRDQRVGKHLLSIAPQGITDQSGPAVIVIPWKAALYVVLTDKYIYIYRRAADAYIVPRRAFPSATSFEHFAETARTYLERSRDDTVAAV
jgi:hypothetical protein